MIPHIIGIQTITELKMISAVDAALDRIPASRIMIMRAPPNHFVALVMKEEKIDAPHLSPRS
eukprot:8450343-Karenia_brevis.AAC.1